MENTALTSARRGRGPARAGHGPRRAWRAGGGSGGSGWAPPLAVPTLLLPDPPTPAPAGKPLPGLDQHGQGDWRARAPYLASCRPPPGPSAPAPEPLSIGDPELQEPLCVGAPQSGGPCGTSRSNPATGTLGHPAREAPPDGLGSSLVRELPNPSPARHPLPHRGPAAAPAPRAGATKGNRGCWNLRCHGDGDHRTHIW